VGSQSSGAETGAAWITGVRGYNDRIVIVAIDGPSGAGKGTVARALAQALAFTHIDTGAMYRAVGWRAQQQGLPLDDEAVVAKVATEARFDLSGGRVRIDGYDVTTAIRTPQMDTAATSVARLPAVRAALVAKQRAMGSTGDVVMEGRDIGTTVFPNADVKIFLDADPTERARRRANDPAHTGQGTAVAAVATAMEARDHADRTRTASPLAVAPDAIHIDTTNLTVEAAVAKVLEVVREKRLVSG
jgi:CMP/dCMP kinase